MPQYNIPVFHYYMVFHFFHQYMSFSPQGDTPYFSTLKDDCKKRAIVLKELKRTIAMCSRTIAVCFLSNLPPSPMLLQGDAVDYNKLYDRPAPNRPTPCSLENNCHVQFLTDQPAQNVLYGSILKYCNKRQTHPNRIPLFRYHCSQTSNASKAL
jgi:hypothetical protein